MILMLGIVLGCFLGTACGQLFVYARLRAVLAWMGGMVLIAVLLSCLYRAGVR